MNTLRNEIEQILERTQTVITMGKDFDEGAARFQVDGQPLLDTLLSAIKNRLPKEQKRAATVLPDGTGAAPLDYRFRDGYNTCLAEVRKALDIETYT